MNTHSAASPASYAGSDVWSWIANASNHSGFGVNMAGAELAHPTASTVSNSHEYIEKILKPGESSKGEGAHGPVNEGGPSEDSFTRQLQSSGENHEGGEGNPRSFLLSPYVQIPVAALAAFGAWKAGGGTVLKTMWKNIFNRAAKPAGNSVP